MVQIELRPGLVDVWKQIIMTTKKTTTLVKHFKLSEPIVSDFDFSKCAADNSALILHSDKVQCLSYNDIDYPFFAVCFLVGFVKVLDLLQKVLPEDFAGKLDWYLIPKTMINTLAPQSKELLHPALTPSLDRLVQLLQDAESMWAFLNVFLIADQCFPRPLPARTCFFFSIYHSLLNYDLFG